MGAGLGLFVLIAPVAQSQQPSTDGATTISAIYGGVALLHIWRLAHDERSGDFFVQPDRRTGLKLGISLELAGSGSVR